MSGKISINYNNPLHKTTSHIIGANRNHLSDEPNLAGKLDTYAKIKPTFGGGRKLYRLGHGPTDGRLDPPNEYMTGYHFEEWWDRPAEYPYDDIRLGLNEAKRMDCDITVVVNFGSGTPEEAGRLVSYLNKKDDAVRNAHGDEPWNVTYFELGNEVTWRLQVGHDPHCMSPEIYAKRCKEFAYEMRKNSDIPIKIGLVGCTSGSWINDDWDNDESSDRLHNIIPFFEFMGDDMDFITYHGYPEFGNSDFEMMCSNQWFTDKLAKKVIPTVRESEKKFGLSHPVDIANSEYFSAGYSNSHHQDMLEALYTADTIVTCLNLDIKMAVSFCFSYDKAAIAQSLFFLEDDPNQPTMLFKVHELFSTNLGNRVLESTGEGLPTTPAEFLDGGAVCNLSHAATLLDDGTVALVVVNRMDTGSVTTSIELGFKHSRAELLTFNGGSYDNKHADYSETPLEDLAQVTFPSASVSVLRIHP